MIIRKSYCRELTYKWRYSLHCARTFSPRGFVDNRNRVMSILCPTIIVKILINVAYDLEETMN